MQEQKLIVFVESHFLYFCTVRPMSSFVVKNIPVFTYLVFRWIYVGAVSKKRQIEVCVVAMLSFVQVFAEHA